MRAWVAVAVLCLTMFSGCVSGPAPVDQCAALRARAPTQAPDQEVLSGDLDALAHRFGRALRDPLVGAGTNDTGGSLWHTANGTVSQSVRGHEARLAYMSYHTESAWTAWDGSHMEADLRSVLEGLGLDPGAYEWEGPVEGDFDDSVAVYARMEGVRNAWWRVQITHEDEPWDDEAVPWQQVMLSGRLDADALPALLSDAELGEMAISNARCDLLDQGESPSAVRVASVDETAFWFHGSPGKYVMLEVGACGGGYYILDAVSGAVLEGTVSANCPVDPGT